MPLAAVTIENDAVANPQSDHANRDDDLEASVSSSTTVSERRKRKISDLIRQVHRLQLHIEPLIIILAACQSMFGVITPTLAEDKMKRAYVPPPKLSQSAKKKFFNKKMAIWDRNYNYVNTPLSMILAIIYGGLSDRYGRKWPLIFGMFSTIVSNGIKLLVWWPETDWPLYWYYISGALAGVLGDFSLCMTCVNSYLTDQFPEKGLLGTRMVVVSILFSTGNFIGSELTSWLLHYTTEMVIGAICQALIVVAIVYAIIVLTRKSTMPSIDASHEGDRDRDDLSLFALIRESFLSIYESVIVFLEPREGSRRMFLYVCFLANFLDQFVFGEEKGLIGTYTKLEPFSWSTSTYSHYKTVRPVVQIVGMLFGLLVLKRWLKWRDTTCIMLAIASMGLCALVTGLASASWVIFAALAPGSLHGLLNPLAYTFLSCIVEHEQVGKVFALASIASQSASLLQSLILQNIYTATVDWYQGFVWLLLAFLSVIVLLLYVPVHIKAKLEGVGR